MKKNLLFVLIVLMCALAMAMFYLGIGESYSHRFVFWLIGTIVLILTTPVAMKAARKKVFTTFCVTFAIIYALFSLIKGIVWFSHTIKENKQMNEEIAELVEQNRELRNQIETLRLDVQ